MPSLIVIQPTDTVAASRSVINSNFALLYSLATGQSGSQSLNFPSIPRGEYADQTISAIGAIAGQPVAIGPPAALEAGLSPVAWISADGVITVRLTNNLASGDPVDPAAAVYTWATGMLGLARSSASLSSSAIPRGESADLTIVAPGVLAGQAVSVGAPVTLEAGLSFSAWASALNTITVRLTNNLPSGDPVTHVLSVWTWVAF